MPQRFEGQAPHTDWSYEAEMFRYHPPDPRAPRGAPELEGWGIPPDLMPPKDAVEHVLAMFKRVALEIPQSSTVPPQEKWSIVCVCMAHFLWLRTKPGAEWLLKLWGVEEVFPFFRGYKYFVANQDSGQFVRIDENGPLELRIFRSCDQDVKPPISSNYDPNIDEMVKILHKVRSPRARTQMPLPGHDMFFWVSEHIRDWLAMRSPNKHWPRDKPDRISGYQWIKSVVRPDGNLFYAPLDKVEMYKGRAYRIKDQRGGVMWTGKDGVVFRRLDDYLRDSEAMAEADIENHFRCRGCKSTRPCLPVTGDQALCCHCYGVQVERGDRPTLDWCTMDECHGCPEHIEGESSLIRFKNKLNREVKFPVSR